MIFLGETSDPARELAFQLPDSTDPLTGVTGHTFVDGEVLIRLPGAAAFVNADVANVVERGYGGYALVLTDAQVATKGKVYLRTVIASGVQNATWTEDIVSRADLAASIGATIPGSQRVWTLCELRDAVRLRGQLEGSVDITDALLKEFVNEGIAELWDLLKLKADDRLVTSATMSATANVAAVALPAGFYALRKLEIVDSSAASGYRQLHSVSLDAKHRYSRITGKNYRYWANNYNIELVPAPTQAETLRCYYIPVATLLEECEDTMDGYNGYEELVIQLAFRRCLVRQELSTDPADSEIARLTARITTASDGRDAEPFYLDPRGASGAFDDEDIA